MSIGLSTRWLLGATVLAAMAPGAASAQTKIYVVTDLEGASGVYQFAQSRDGKETPLGQKAMEYLMGDIAAVVRGLRDAGATEILVIDGHGTQAFVPHLMEPGAKYVTGKPRPHAAYEIDETWSGLVMLAYQAVAAIHKCKPYKLKLPIHAKVQYLDLTGPLGPDKKPRLVTKEAILQDTLHMTSF